MSIGVVTILLGFVFAWGTLNEKVNRLERDSIVYMTSQKVDSDRITKLETQYISILDSLKDIKAYLEKTAK